MSWVLAPFVQRWDIFLFDITSLKGCFNNGIVVGEGYQRHFRFFESFLSYRETIGERGYHANNLNTIRHRIAVYHNQTEPITHYYLHQGNYFAVNGNHNMEDVFIQVKRIIDREGRK